MSHGSQIVLRIGFWKALMLVPANLYSMRGVLPHHLDEWPEPTAMPPYSIPLGEFAHHFAYSPARIDLFRGLLEFRKVLKTQGISGFQWVDGSFVQSEAIYGRDPEDIDILTWVICDSMVQFEELVQFIDSEAMKRDNHCHVFFAPAVGGQIPWPLGAYWLWLFGHTNTAKVLDEKDRGLGKGFLQIELADSEEHLILGGDHA